jgi:CheY-like chemotaxis protein
MARITLCESDPDVRRLLVVLVERLGHEAIVPGGGTNVPPPADLLLVEPASAICLAQARAARARYPGLPVICVSMLPANAGFLTLGPFRYLTKPFSLAELSEAIAAALATRVSL